jgi:hypothetical protein
LAVRAVAGRFEASGTDMDGPIARTRGSRLKFTTLFSFGLKGLAMLATLGGQVILARSMAIETFGIYVSVIASTTVLSAGSACHLPPCASSLAIRLKVTGPCTAAFSGARFGKPC